MPPSPFPANVKVLMALHAPVALSSRSMLTEGRGMMVRPAFSDVWAFKAVDANFGSRICYTDIFEESLWFSNQPNITNYKYDYKEGCSLLHAGRV